MKSKIIIIVLIVIIIAILLVALLMNRNKTTQPQGNGNVITNNGKSSWDDGYVPSIPENYTQVSKDNISSETDVVPEAIAYRYDSEEDITYVNVYLQNRGEKALDKDSVCVIELYDENGQLYRFGGVLENATDIASSERTVVRTQFIEKTAPIVSAKISFEVPEETEEVVEERIEAPVETPDETPEGVEINA